MHEETWHCDALWRECSRVVFGSAWDSLGGCRNAGRNASMFDAMQLKSVCCVRFSGGSYTKGQRPMFTMPTEPCLNLLLSGNGQVASSSIHCV